MTAVLVVGAVVVAGTGLFVGWVYVMNRRDERESRRERDRVRSREPWRLGDPRPRPPWRR
jgi:hypothetical protein